MTALSEMISPSQETEQEWDREFIQWGSYNNELLGARPFELSRDSLKMLFDLHSQHESLFSDLIDKSFERFAAYLVNNARFFTEVVTLPDREHVGFLYLTDLLLNEVEPNQIVSAFGHFSFWSGKLGERRRMIRELIELIARGFKMHRLSVRLPVYAPGAIRAATKIGFTGDFPFRLRDREIKVEAVLREAIKYKGEWREMIIMSLVGDELWAKHLARQQPGQE